ncbi:hypothetical protein B0T21DRAFT_185692 [Apiosordaria backusii]|uniref:Uncharacterized protein n=1 Tax=Apiosordaria backusii TaxID=314023 RepID=A0AA40EEF7_9PEZI|nr:hypothetical protein B0T21DRAFT_185692 [Apiosordaria backusii]
MPSLTSQHQPQPLMGKLMTFINLILSCKEARDIDASQPQERIVWSMTLSNRYRSFARSAFAMVATRHLLHLLPVHRSLVSSGGAQQALLQTGLNLSLFVAAVPVSRVACRISCSLSRGFGRHIEFWHMEAELSWTSWSLPACVDLRSPEPCPCERNDIDQKIGCSAEYYSAVSSYVQSPGSGHVVKKHPRRRQVPTVRSCAPELRSYSSCFIEPSGPRRDHLQFNPARRLDQPLSQEIFLCR